MRVSIIIPAYNSAHFLGTTILSVMKQAYDDYEIVIVDDGSTDNTREIVKSFPGVCTYLYQRNAGPSAARNRGIENSNGELIAFLDADDAWLPGKLHAQVAIMDQNPEVGLVETGSFLCDDHLYPVRYLPPARLRGQVFEEMLIESKVPNTSTVLVRRIHLQQAGGFDSTYRNVEDYELWLRLAQLCRFDYLEEAFAYQRVHEGHSLKDGRYMLEMYSNIVSRHVSNNPSLKLRMIAALERAEMSAIKLMCFQHQWRDAVPLAICSRASRGWRHAVTAYLYLLLLIVPKRFIPKLRTIYWQFSGG